MSREIFWEADRTNEEGRHSSPPLQTLWTQYRLPGILLSQVRSFSLLPFLSMSLFSIVSCCCLVALAAQNGTTAKNMSVLPVAGPGMGQGGGVGGAGGGDGPLSSPLPPPAPLLRTLAILLHDYFLFVKKQSCKRIARGVCK